MCNIIHNKKKVLILCSGYPSLSTPYNCTWAHIRNRYYLENGLDIDVVITSDDVAYCIDGVSVINHSVMFERINNQEYDLVISHSPNIRQHLPILMKVKNTKIMLFMHGTESMWLNYDYPKPYDYESQSCIKRFTRDVYDFVKFKALKWFVNKNRNNIHIVFVSNWMKDMFEKNVMNTDGYQYSVVNNSINKEFIKRPHSLSNNIMADFVTLRRLDHSKYAIDLVCSFANANPQYSFHIYGQGWYFDYNNKPANVTVFDTHIKQDEIPDLLNHYRYALMPTRCDAQGVMVCEMATFGMPVITSDIPVNQEMFNEFENVTLLKNSQFNHRLNISELLNLSTLNNRNTSRFSHETTLSQEVSVIMGFL